MAVLRKGEMEKGREKAREGACDTKETKDRSINGIAEEKGKGKGERERKKHKWGSEVGEERWIGEVKEIKDIEGNTI